MTESWELGTDEFLKKRGFIYCNSGANPTLSGFLVQIILRFISHLVLFQEVSLSASTESALRYSLTLGAEGKPTARSRRAGQGGSERFTHLGSPTSPGGFYASRISCDSSLNQVRFRSPSSCYHCLCAPSRGAGGHSSPVQSPPLPRWQRELVNDLLIQLEGAH